MTVTLPAVKSLASENSSDRKLIGLEVLRFATAVAILVFHYPHFGTVLAQDTYNTRNLPFHGLLTPLYNYGFLGVQLFWSISGFIFAWKYAALIGSGGISFRRFAMLRFSRLFPLHFVTLLVVAGMQLIYRRHHESYFVFQINDLKHFVLNLFFASYWGFQDGWSFNGPSWSISLEVLIYALFFCSCRFAGTSDGRAMLTAYIMFVIANTLNTFHYEQIFSAALNFYLGALACCLYRIIMVHSRACRIIVACGAVLTVGLLMLPMCIAPTIEHQPNAMIWPAVILAVQLCVPDHGSTASRCVTWFGDMTYASYLLHFPIQLAAVQIIELAGLRMQVLFHEPAFFIGYLLVVLVASRTVFLGFERPAQTLLRRCFLRSTSPVSGLTQPTIGRLRVAHPTL